MGGWSPFAVKVTFSYIEGAKGSFDKAGRQAVRQITDKLIDKTIEYAKNQTRPGERVDRVSQGTIEGETSVKLVSVCFDPGAHPGPHKHRYHDKPELNWTDTGDLQRSIGETTPRKWRGNRYGGTVGTNLWYGQELEVGWFTKEGRRVHYPWLQPSATRAYSEVMDDPEMQDALKTALGQALPTRRAGKVIRSHGEPIVEELPL